MAGLLDFLAGSSDPSTADPTTGLVESQRRQLAYGILGQTGAALLAAGAPSYPGQQGQYLAQLGNIPGNVADQQSQMVQQNAMAQQAQIRKQKVEQDKAAAAYVQTPEFQQLLGKMPDELKAQALVNIKAGNYTAATAVTTDWVKMQIAAQQQNLQWQREANKMQITHDQAGNPIGVYPMTGKTVQLGGTQDNAAAYGLSPPSGGQASGGASASMPTAGAPSLPDGTPITDTGGGQSPTAAGMQVPTKNPNYPHASISPTADYSQIFGIGPTLGYGMGVVQGHLAPGSISAAGSLQDQGIAEYHRMRLGLSAEARSEQPNSRLKNVYSAVEDTLPTTTTNPHTALTQLTSAKNQIASALQNSWQLFNAPSTPRTERAKLASEIQSLRTHYDNLNMVTDSMAQAQGGTRPAVPAQNSGGKPAEGVTRRLRYNLQTRVFE